MGDEVGNRTAPVPFRVTLAGSADVVRVAAVGEVDMSTVDEFSNALTTALTTPGARRVVVDLADVTFLASSGISALIGAYRSGQRLEKTIGVVNCRPTVARVLEITGVDKVLWTADESTEESTPGR